MPNDAAAECCPQFDPAPWDEQERVWDHKRFVKDHVTSFFHIPLNFGAIMRRNIGPIEAANARPESMIVLSDETSLWGADVYIEATENVPGRPMATLSGRFVSKVFEGPYRNIGRWVADMQAFLKSRDLDAQKLYFYYTTCPKCAKKHGKNYVVILAQV